jgi:DNA (cytosine-5)-methyltransferase 1
MAIGELERGQRFEFSFERNKWDSFPSVSPLCVGDDGFSDRLDSITFSKWRKESIKAGGNAIVPQVAYQIFKTIEQFEQLNKQA